MYNTHKCHVKDDAIWELRSQLLYCLRQYNHTPKPHLSLTPTPVATLWQDETILVTEKGSNKDYEGLVKKGNKNLLYEALCCMMEDYLATHLKKIHYRAPVVKRLASGQNMPIFTPIKWLSQSSFWSQDKCQKQTEKPKHLNPNSMLLPYINCH